MQAYLLTNHYHKKVLCVDIDPQANLTWMISETYRKDLMHPARDFYSGFIHGNLNNSIVHVTSTLDIIPSNWRMNKLVDEIAETHSDERFWILKKLLKPLKSRYDYILIDVPPTSNDIVLNAIFAADGISIVLQTQTLSYLSAVKTVSELIKLKHKYHPDFHFLGVIIYLVNRAKNDKDVIKKAESVFKSGLYKERIKFQERVKGFTSTGIEDKDHWDMRAIGNYYQVNKEIMERASEMIK